jgi:hypothetical protein
MVARLVDWFVISKKDIGRAILFLALNDFDGNIAERANALTCLCIA